MRVLKFGGTSVATAESVHRVVEIVGRAREAGPVAIVVSAFGGVTNGLLKTAAIASRREDAWETELETLKSRHRSTAAELLGTDSAAATEVLDQIESRFEELHELLRGVYLLRECSPRIQDAIVTYGERLSALVVAAALNKAGIEAEACDTRPLIVTDASFGKAQVDVDMSFPRLSERIRGSKTVQVVTGFTGATAEGHTTTLGRGGSDYTAALVGAAINARAIELWTDVSGVMSSDPRVVPQAFPQEAMSYAELMELSHFGAKVVYPPSIHPARSRGIPLLIKNTFAPDDPGTEVTDDAAPADGPVRGITSVRDVALMRLEGDGMVGVPGIAQRLFGALAQEQVSVILISQSSSEHSICFAVAKGDAEAARRSVNKAFELERRLGYINDVVVEEGHTVVAAVGEQMAHHPGIAGKLFAVLGAHGVNVRAIAQGSSELNISAVVEAGDEVKAVRAVHDAFFATDHRRLEVFLLGVGTVGGALLSQLHQASHLLRDKHGLDLRVVGAASSRGAIQDPDGLPVDDPDGLRDRLAAAAQADGGANPEAWVDAFAERNGALKVLVDCTASDQVKDLYIRALAQGVGVVAANKKIFSGPAADFDHLHTLARQGRASLFFETTAGAGLPVLSTLKDLTRTGDQVLGVDAVLSGTLNAILDRLSPEMPFSAAVRAAYDEGLTEPNPYDDLSGLDVMRKLCIIARASGHSVEPESVQVEPLLPAEPWAELDLEGMWSRLPELDEPFEQQRRAAEEQGCRLRYVASIDEQGQGRVAMQSVPSDHPAYGLTGPDNLVAFTTNRYRHSPVVVRGPGAGPEVTAAGVFADILHAAADLDRRRL